jgi:uncharacterized membrane protein YccF (DUF307 family)/uncharacterized membrane protein YhaH (DUF805 family)
MVAAAMALSFLDSEITDDLFVGELTREGFVLFFTALLSVTAVWPVFAVHQTVQTNAVYKDIHVAMTAAVLFLFASLIPAAPLFARRLRHLGIPTRHFIAMLLFPPYSPVVLYACLAKSRLVKGTALSSVIMQADALISSVLAGVTAVLTRADRLLSPVIDVFVSTMLSRGPVMGARVGPRIGFPVNYFAFVGNLLWFVFGGGFIAWLLWFLAGIVFSITIIGIPFAKATFRISVFAAFPFGRELIDSRLVGNRRITGTGFINVVWCIVAGLWLAILHALAGLFYCITILGIPFGFAHFKLAQVSFAPLGKTIVSTDVAKAARARAANAQLDQSLALSASDRTST